MRKYLFALIILFSLSFGYSQNKIKPIEPKDKDKCPVCGMFVKDYPEWWCEIILNNGKVYFFDGTKDMFKFYLQPEAYGVKKKFKIVKVYVKDYYTLDWIDAYSAYYVIDSDVYGPMGNELIPFTSKEDAIEFKYDHNGSKILQFNDIDWELLTRLSQGSEM